MPYTPPSQLSPAASKTTSPAPSRSQSFLKGQHLSPELPFTPTNRPNLPRSSQSSSYLNRHRRSPSLNDVQKAGTIHNGELSDVNTFDPHGSIRQTPPPKTNSLIPAGMTISPPESSHNSSDDESETQRGRTRDLELDNLKELQAAISIIHQRKESSPDRRPDSARKAQFHLEPESPSIDGDESPRLSHSNETQKIAHSRSMTDHSIIYDASQPRSPVRFSDSDDDSENSEGSDRSSSRPAMVRKKSGELVRPALRPPSRRRPSSMPGTPTYSKAVHFDSHLEHVRHFLQVDRPLAVSAGSSPVEAYESENEFPFGGDEASARPRTQAYEWEIRLANFPPDSIDRTAQPVRVERVFISSDNKSLIGTIAVHNLAFQKSVAARFTLDYWTTTSEVQAEFNHDVRRRAPTDGHDRFSFNIRLADQANLENKTLFFCVKYSVNGQEYWDNNGSYNYQVDFTKKLKPQSNKNTVSGLGVRPLSALPRSRPSAQSSPNLRPKSMPTSFDDFTTGWDSYGMYNSSAASLMDEPRIKLRNPRSKAELVPDAPARRHKSNGQAFGNRYDFSSSLNAAKQNAYNILGDDSGLSPSKNVTKQSSREVPAATAVQSGSTEKVVNGVKGDSLSSGASNATPSPAALLSGKPPVTSSTYQELVDKYCFFGAPKAGIPLTSQALGNLDGTREGYLSSSDQSVESSLSSGSSTPTGHRAHSPSPPSEVSSTKTASPQTSRSVSPMPRSRSCLGSGRDSPLSFGYPFHTSSPHGLLSSTPPATAIRG